MRELGAQHPRREALDLVGDVRGKVDREGRDEQVHVVGHHVLGDDPPSVLLALEADEFVTAGRDRCGQHRAAVSPFPVPLRGLSNSPAA
jgi:hypothetical protein